MTEKLNLVVFVRDYPTGMAGTKRVHNFIEYLIRQDIIINVISFRSQIRQPSLKGVHRGIPYITVGQGLKMKLSKAPSLLTYYLRGLSAIYSLRKKGCKNLVYSSGGISIENLIFLLWSKIIGYKLVLAIEEDYTFFRDNIKLISRFKFWTVRKFDFLNSRLAEAVVVISNHLKEKYVRLKARTVILIPVTAKLNFNQQKSNFNSPLQVIYAGSFADKDGVSDIIEGFLTFNKKFQDSTLILTGHSEQQKYYQEKYKDEKSLVFPGFLEDEEFYGLIRDADVLCMCRTESGFANSGFPFKLGEYLATGNPVICTKVSDVQNYLDEDDAYLTEPGKPFQIYESLKQIVNNPAEARIKGLNGMEKCRRHFSPENNGARLYELMISVADS